MAEPVKKQTMAEPVKKKSKPMDKNGAIQKIFILENTDVRTKSTGEIYGVTGVLAKSTNYSQIHDVFLPEKLIQKFKESVQKSIIVRKYSQKEDGFISLTDSSTIMDTTDDISQEDITKFLNPDIVDIATIKTKKRNERVSLQGIVEKSTRIIETPQSSRKIYTIADTSGNIDVKFWGDKTSLGPIQDGTNIKITALKVDQYGGRCSLNSTPSTAVQINEDYDSLQGDVQAACFDEDNMSIMLNNQIYNISATLMKHIFPNQKFCPGKNLTAITSCNEITDVVEIDDGHEE